MIIIKHTRVVYVVTFMCVCVCVVAQGSVSSVSSVVVTMDESPPPAPPRSTSVRMSISQKGSSREGSPASTQGVSLSNLLVCKSNQKVNRLVAIFESS